MMIQFKRFKRTDEFNAWMLKLDKGVRQLLTATLRDYELEGILPNTAGLLQGTDGIGEMRFKFGAGYRIYFCRYGDVVLLLLVGGDKGTQTGDIKAAQTIKNREIEKARLLRGNK